MQVVARACLLAVALVVFVGDTSCAFVTSTVSRTRSRPNASASAAEEAAPAAGALEQEVLDFAIIGAGPAGLAAAVGLKEKGLNVKVFEGEL